MDNKTYSKEIYEEIFNDPQLFESLDNDLKEDIDFILELLEFGVLFEEIHMFVSDNVKNSEDLFKVILEDAYNLRFAGDKIKNNRVLIRRAYNSDYVALQFASKEIKNDFEFVSDLLKIDVKGYRFIGKNLKLDVGLALYAYKKNLDLLRYAKSNTELIESKEFLYGLEKLHPFKNIRPFDLREILTTKLEEYKREDSLLEKLENKNNKKATISKKKI